MLRVAQVVDSLAPGGAERFAVNLANSLADAGHESHLCSTRAEGPLASELKPGVGRAQLNRSLTFDPFAFVAFAKYLTRHRIQVLHAHSSSVFISMIAAGMSKAAPGLVWHLHQGKLAQSLNPPLHLWLVSRRVDAVIAVSRPLADWAIKSLGVPASRVHYIANFVRTPQSRRTDLQLPGSPGFRIVSVANLRPEKDTLTLLAAMTDVVAQFPHAHLILVGGCADQAYGELVKAEVANRGLTNSVSFLGPRDDVPNVLQACDVAVLSSAAEGFPLTMLEYGAASLGTVATSVGACPEILDYGRAGVLVPPSAPNELASAISNLLRSPDLRSRLGTVLKLKVEHDYGEQKILLETTQVYELATSSTAVRTGLTVAKARTAPR